MYLFKLTVKVIVLELIDFDLLKDLYLGDFV